MTEAPLGTLELRMRGRERGMRKERDVVNILIPLVQLTCMQRYFKTVLYYYEYQWKKGRHLTKTLWCDDFTPLMSGLVSRWAVASGTNVLPPLVPTYSTYSAHPVDGKRKRGRVGLFVNNLFHSCAHLLVCNNRVRTVAPTNRMTLCIGITHMTYICAKYVL